SGPGTPPGVRAAPAGSEARRYRCTPPGGDRAGWIDRVLSDKDPDAPRSEPPSRHPADPSSQRERFDRQPFQAASPEQLPCVPPLRATPTRLADGLGREEYALRAVRSGWCPARAPRFAPVLVVPPFPQR